MVKAIVFRVRTQEAFSKHLSRGLLMQIKTARKRIQKILFAYYKNEKVHEKDSFVCSRWGLSPPPRMLPYNRRVLVDARKALVFCSSIVSNMVLSVHTMYLNPRMPPVFRVGREITKALVFCRGLGQSPKLIRKVFYRRKIW